MKDKLVNKLKSYGFWMSLASAVFVFLNTLGMKVDIPYLTQITTAFLGILAVAGIISRPGGDGGQIGGEEIIEDCRVLDNDNKDCDAVGGDSVTI